MITMQGDPIKVVDGKVVYPLQTRFVVILRTIPRTDINPYGIVVQDLTYENLKKE